MGESSSVAHGQCSQGILNVVKLVDDIVYSLFKGIARQLQVVIDVKDSVADEGHSAVTLQQLEVEEGTQETGLGLIGGTHRS